ncbi:hypothetical protein F4775DRAFT_532357 [Biscogniauxia sp. FL1348]|nr:hypothetical protein F4775DRAFT_532357 [Biscogniauxia sp. FL1348]
MPATVPLSSVSFSLSLTFTAVSYYIRGNLISKRQPVMYKSCGVGLVIRVVILYSGITSVRVSSRPS